MKIALYAVKFYSFFANPLWENSLCS